MLCTGVVDTKDTLMTKPSASSEKLELFRLRRDEPDVLIIVDPLLRSFAKAVSYRLRARKKSSQFAGHVVLNVGKIFKGKLSPLKEMEIHLADPKFIPPCLKGVRVSCNNIVLQESVIMLRFDHFIKSRHRRCCWLVSHQETWNRPIHMMNGHHSILKVANNFAKDCDWRRYHPGSHMYGELRVRCGKHTDEFRWEVMYNDFLV